MNESTKAILEARSAINALIATRDAAGIGAFLLPTDHAVTARSMHRDGREGGVKSWASMFERDAAATHAGAPDRIEVNEEWGMAHEQGRWSATIKTRDCTLVVSGIYAAKWHNTAAGSMLEAEIFTPLRTRAKGSLTEETER